MRIAYACYWDARRLDGVAAKLTSQAHAWRRAGHEVELHVLSPAPRAGEAIELAGAIYPFDGRLGRPVATRRLYQGVAAWRPDLVYLRYDLFAPPPTPLTRAAPTVVEINSKLQVELAERSRLAAGYERVQDAMLLRRTAGAVCVSGELAHDVHARRADLAVVVVGNGVDLTGIPTLPPAAAERIRVAYMGDAVWWQGVDKILELAAALPEWHFDLIGVEPLEAPPNVTCHGFLARERYEPLLASADLALGTLALHRKDLDETSALKVPLYLAYGLPIVIGYADTNLDGLDAWYLLRLPNVEANVREGIARIEAFGRSVKGRRVPRDEIAGRISVDAKEAERLAFFETIRTGRR